MSCTTCTHIKVNGIACNAPALRGEQFCYFHQRMHRTVRRPNSRVHHVALLESPEAIQASIMEVVNCLIRDSIELRRADLILRALYIAVRNSRNARFDIQKSEVEDVPHYEPNDEVPLIAHEIANEISLPLIPDPPRWPRRPPERPMDPPIAAPINPEPASTPAPPPPKPAASKPSASVASAATPQRKPPLRVKETPAPQARSAARNAGG